MKVFEVLYKGHAWSFVAQTEFQAVGLFMELEDVNPKTFWNLTEGYKTREIVEPELSVDCLDMEEYNEGSRQSGFDIPEDDDYMSYKRFMELYGSDTPQMIATNSYDLD